MDKLYLGVVKDLEAIMDYKCTTTQKLSTLLNIQHNIDELCETLVTNREAESLYAK